MHVQIINDLSNLKKKASTNQQIFSSNNRSNQTKPNKPYLAGRNVNKM
jgi:hypothetical protein